MTAQLAVVYGASGFLGRNAVRALAKAGYRIRAVTRRPNLAQYLPPSGTVGQIQLFKGDVTDADSVAAALAKAYVVVNLVGLLSPGGGQDFEEMHVEAAETIA